MKILLATDGSDYSKAAVKAVADRPWLEGPEVKIISVDGVTEISPPLEGVTLMALKACDTIHVRTRNFDDCRMLCVRTLRVADSTGV